MTMSSGEPEDKMDGNNNDEAMKKTTEEYLNNNDDDDANAQEEDEVGMTTTTMDDDDDDDDDDAIVNMVMEDTAVMLVDSWDSSSSSEDDEEETMNVTTNGGAEVLPPVSPVSSPQPQSTAVLDDNFTSALLATDVVDTEVGGKEDDEEKDKEAPVGVNITTSSLSPVVAALVNFPTERSSEVDQYSVSAEQFVILPSTEAAAASIATTNAKNDETPSSSSDVLVPSVEDKKQNATVAVAGTAGTAVLLTENETGADPPPPPQSRIDNHHVTTEVVEVEEKDVEQFQTKDPQSSSIQSSATCALSENTSSSSSYKRHHPATHVSMWKQIWALSKKNLLLKTRTPFQTFFEFMTPLGMCLVIWIGYGLATVTYAPTLHYTNMTVAVPGILEDTGFLISATTDFVRRRGLRQLYGEDHPYVPTNNDKEHAHFSFNSNDNSAKHASSLLENMLGFVTNNKGSSVGSYKHHEDAVAATSMTELMNALYQGHTSMGRLLHSDRHRVTTSDGSSESEDPMVDSVTRSGIDGKGGAIQEHFIEGRQEEKDETKKQQSKPKPKPPRNETLNLPDGSLVYEDDPIPGGSNAANPTSFDTAKANSFLYDLFSQPLVVPTFGQFVLLSAAVETLSSDLTSSDIYQIIEQSAYGRALANLFDTGTLHLVPTESNITTNFIQYLKHEFPMAFNNTVLPPDTFLNIQTHSTMEDALWYIDQHPDERTWALIDLSEAFVPILPTTVSAEAAVASSSSNATTLEEDGTEKVSPNDEHKQVIPETDLLAEGDWMDSQAIDVNHIKFTIRMNYTTLPNTAAVTELRTIGLNTLYQRYYMSGFLTLQRTLEDFALYQVQQIQNNGTKQSNVDDSNTLTRRLAEWNSTTTNNNDTSCELPSYLQMWSMPMPTAELEQNTFFITAGYLMGLAICMGFLYPFSRLVKSMVEEKELRLRETLFMCGVKPFSYWVSWMLQATTLFTIEAALVTWILSRDILTNTTVGYLFAFFWLFGLAIIGFGYFLVSMFSHSKLAAMVGPVALFATIMPRYLFYGTNRDEQAVGKLFASLLPATAFSLGTDILSDFEYAKIGVNKQTASMGAYSFNTCLWMMAIDAVVYSILGWYLDHVLPSEFGVRQPFYFFLLPSYWGCQNCCQWVCWSKKNTTTNNTTGEEHSKDHTNDNDDYEPVAQDMGSPKVVVKNLVKRYPGATRNAVDSLNLNLYENQITCLLGHNGAGKSSTISVMTGLYPATSGDVTMYGHSLSRELAKARQSMGICPQHNVLFPHLTVEEHLELFIRIKGLEIKSSKHMRHLIKHKAVEVGLGDKLAARAKQLSGGMKRKLNLALALVGDPKFVLLDEPTSGMDPFSRRATWDLLRQTKQGRVTLLTTHFMDEAEYLSDSIAVMKSGKLRCCGSTVYLKQRFGLGYALTVVLNNNKPPRSTTTPSSPNHYRRLSSPPLSGGGGSPNKTNGSTSTSMTAIPEGDATVVADSAVAVVNKAAANNNKNNQDEMLEGGMMLSSPPSIPKPSSSEGTIFRSSSYAGSGIHGYTGGTEATARMEQTLELLEFLRQYIPGTELYRRNGKEVTFRFPSGAEHSFEKLFEGFDTHKEMLGVGGYGVANSSLEEVFLRLAEDPALDDSLSNQTKQMGSSNGHVPIHKPTTASAIQQSLSGASSGEHSDDLLLSQSFDRSTMEYQGLSEPVITKDLPSKGVDAYADTTENAEEAADQKFIGRGAQIWVLLKKRALVQKRDLKGFFFMIVLPACLIGLVLLLLMIDLKLSGPPLDMDMSMYSTKQTSVAGIDIPMATDNANNSTKAMDDISILSETEGASSSSSSTNPRNGTNVIEPAESNTTTSGWALFKSLLEGDYTFASIRNIPGLRTSEDLSMYLLNTMEEDTKVKGRFGGFTFEDRIKVGLKVNWDSVWYMLNINKTVETFVQGLPLPATSAEEFANQTVSSAANATGGIIDVNGVQVQGSDVTEFVTEGVSSTVSGGGSTGRTDDDDESDGNSTATTSAPPSKQRSRGTMVAALNSRKSGRRHRRHYTRRHLQRQQNGILNDDILSNPTFLQAVFNAMNGTSSTNDWIPLVNQMSTQDLNTLTQFFNTLGLTETATSVSGTKVQMTQLQWFFNALQTFETTKQYYQFRDFMLSFLMANGVQLSEDLLQGDASLSELFVAFFPNIATPVANEIQSWFVGEGNITEVLESLNITATQEAVLGSIQESLPKGKAFYNLELPSNISIMHNSTSPHAVAVFNHAVAQSRYKQCTNNPHATFSIVNHPLPVTTKRSLEIRVILSILTAFFILIPYCFIPSAFIVFVVRERSCKSKHVQLVSGVNLTSFWIATYIWDMFMYTLLGILIMITFFIYNTTGSTAVFVGDPQAALATALLTFGYGLTSMPFSYLLARQFNNHSSAQIAILFIFFFTGFCAVAAYYIMDSIPRSKAAAAALRPLFRLWPAFNLGEGFLQLSQSYFMRVLAGEDTYALDWNVTGETIVVLYALAVPYFLWLLLLEYSNDGGSGGLPGRFSRYISTYMEKLLLKWSGVHKNKQGILELNDGLDEQTLESEDADVLLEQQRVHLGEHDLKRSVAIYMNNLWKIYPPSSGMIGFLIYKLKTLIRYMCCCGCRCFTNLCRRNNINSHMTASRQSNDSGSTDSSSDDSSNNPRRRFDPALVPKRAIRGVNVAIERGETFGLLGMNGAGKTSTMGVLTGDQKATSGQAYVAGFDVTGKHSGELTRARKRIGFCPQVDPLLELMTGRETLYMYGRLRGISPNKLPTLVEQLLRDLTLEPFADKPCGTYSGGNKRKLSLGIALVGDPECLFIDESSSGMDPAARRKIWNLISRVSQNKSVMLTTHSMEEAEALCSRLTIMVSGRMRCLGSVQHLKATYLDGYTVDFQLKSNAPDGTMERVLKHLLEEKNNKTHLPLLPNGTRVAEQHSRFLRLSVPSGSGGNITTTTNGSSSTTATAVTTTEPTSIDETSSLSVLPTSTATSTSTSTTNIGLGKLFGIFQTLKDSSEYFVEGYSISQSTLEQVFVQFAQQGDGAVCGNLQQQQTKAAATATLAQPTKQVA